MTKQALIADALFSGIQAGKYKIGDRLPSEPELSLQFGVSRHTVRAALRALHNRGLVTSQQGVGTIVQEVHPVLHYSHGFTSAQDLQQYATTTNVRVIDRIEFAVNAEQAAQFGCKPGEHWWRVRTVRSEPSGHVVVAHSEIYIPLAFGAVLRGSGRSKQPFFALIERCFNETITEIQQEITCISRVTTEQAAYLKVPPESPAMQITRRYLGNGGRVLEVARSFHPSDVFNYSMRVQLRHRD